MKLENFAEKKPRPGRGQVRKTILSVAVREAYGRAVVVGIVAAVVVRGVIAAVVIRRRVIAVDGRAERDADAPVRRQGRCHRREPDDRDYRRGEYSAAQGAPPRPRDLLV